MQIVRVRDLPVFLVRMLFPEVCAGCGVSGTWMCDACRNRCVPIEATLRCLRCGQFTGFPAPSCDRCVSWPAALAEARATFVFEGPVRNAIHRLKYKGERARAEWGGRLMAGTLRTADWEADALIPTPLHRDRLRQRRYNQSRLLASVISGESGIPVRDVLIRHRSTHSQVALDADQRRANVAGAFSAVTRLDGLTVVLVDDVATTGATLVECAIACHAAGALMIRAIVLATDV